MDKTNRPVNAVLQITGMNASNYAVVVRPNRGIQAGVQQQQTMWVTTISQEQNIIGTTGEVLRYD